ncbi:MAG: alpha-amylase family glycosyl hydrolase, partial [Leptospiraceae bacterium]|nr:alpha-amylase family glycosyl hydrolase [Leptospiraceae bacterium]
MRQKVIFLWVLFLSPTITSCNTEQKKAEYQPVFDLTDPEGNPLDIPCSNPQPPNTYKVPTPADWPTIRDMKMGALPSGASVTFRVFAPTAQTVEVVTYDTAAQNPLNPSAAYPMTRDGVGGAGFGVWTVTLDTGKTRAPSQSGSGRIYYRYRLNCMRNYENKPMKERERYVPDPYSLASAGSNGHSIIIDPNWTVNAVFSGWNNATDDIASDISGWFSGSTRPKTADYIVYELHVDDMTGSTSCLQSFTGSSICKNNLQSYYTGNNTLMTAIGATSPDSLSGKYTGLEAMASYLSSDLGINAVHIMPLHEASNDNKDNPEGYGWGYLPSLFFAPESSYSSYCVRTSANEKCVYDDNRAGYQVLELKRLIKRLHAQGIAVILDIVLNHTSNAFNYLYWIEPYGRYYFRTNGLNWSNIGTGNHIFDDRNQRPFAYKYILDNVKYWVKHYHVDGFRFDLAVGTSEQTLRDIQNMLNDGNTPASWTTTVPPSATETSMQIDTEYLVGGGSYANNG